MEDGAGATSGSGCAAAALGYLALGWSVAPVQARGKRPLVRWTALQSARATPAQVAHWYERWPDANVGVVTGTVSGLVVLDVDAGHGGEDSLAELERLHGSLEPTPESLTGGGGRHLYFRHPGREIGNRVGLREGLDLRGDGGMVVAPPSIHPSGRPYRWRTGRDPREIAPAPMPHWLRSLASGDTEHPGHPPAHWRALVREGVAEGARNATVASLTGHLLRHGVDPDVVLELMLCWNRQRCAPPLPDDETASVVASIVRTRERHGA